MTADRMEKGIILALSVLAVSDGLRILLGHRSTFGAPYAGGYLILLGLLIGGLGALSWRRDKAREGESRENPLTKSNLPKRVFLCLGLLSGTAVLIPWLGYMVSTILFFLGHLRLLGGYRWIPALVWSVALGVSFAYVFAMAGMMLPRGAIPWP